MYPVEKNVGNYVKGALFGKSSLKNAREYYERGGLPLSPKLTEKYEKLKKQGVKGDDFIKAYNAQKGIEGDKDNRGKTIKNSASLKKKEAIDKAVPRLPMSQKKKLYQAFDLSKAVQK